MSQLSSSSSFQVPFAAALEDYESRTRISLLNHLFSKQLEECDTPDSIIAIVREQAETFRDFRGDNGKLLKSVNCSVDVLYMLSSSTVLDEGVGVMRLKQSSGFLVLDRHSSHSLLRKPYSLALPSYSLYASLPSLPVACLPDIYSTPSPLRRGISGEGDYVSLSWYDTWLNAAQRIF